MEESSSEEVSDSVAVDSGMDRLLDVMLLLSSIVDVGTDAICVIAAAFVTRPFYIQRSRLITQVRMEQQVHQILLFPPMTLLHHPTLRFVQRSRHIGQHILHRLLAKIRMILDGACFFGLPSCQIVNLSRLPPFQIESLVEKLGPFLLLWCFLMLRITRVRRSAMEGDGVHIAI